MKVIKVPDEDRHFILACKHHYGDLIPALRMVYDKVYQNDVPDQLPYVVEFLARCMVRYPIIEGEYNAREFLLDLALCRKPWHFGAEGADRTEQAIRVMAGQIGNWQVKDRRDGVEYDLGPIEKTWNNPPKALTSPRAQLEALASN